MTRLLPLLLVLLVLMVSAIGWLLVPMRASVATITDVYAALWAMRGVGMGLGRTADPNAREIMINEVLKYSETLTAVLAEAEQNPKHSTETKARLSEFRVTWVEFQKVREEEVIPARRAGDNQRVRQQMAVQNGRFRKMALLVQPRNVPAQNPATVPSRSTRFQAGPGLGQTATGPNTAPGTRDAKSP